MRCTGPKQKLKDKHINPRARNKNNTNHTQSGEEPKFSHPPDPSTLLPSTPPTPRYPVNHTRHSVAHPMTPTQSPNQCAQVRITIECTKLTTTIKSGRVYCESKNPERKTQPCLTRSHSVRSETLLGRTRIPTPTLSDEIQQKTTEKQKVNMDLTFASIFDRTSKGSKGQRIDER